MMDGKPVRYIEDGRNGDGLNTNTRKWNIKIIIALEKILSTYHST